ncbi:MAG: DUF1834 family protein [Phycisphaerae bacterium]|nr:DUF1834 family protein [Phycisphaerae bacterium]
MAALATLESNLVNRLATATLGGQPLLATVRGASGPFRPALRAALARVRTPAAFVAFLDENTSPDASEGRIGPRFSIIVAARTLRLTSDPRVGDAGSTGAFTLLDQVRARLAGYAPAPDTEMVGVHVRFLDADDRAAYYELLYRVAPVFRAPLFDGVRLGGDLSRTTRSVRPLEPHEMRVIAATPEGMIEVFRSDLAPPDSPVESLLVWQGQLRAENDDGLKALVTAIGEDIQSETVATLLDAGGAEFPAIQIRSLRLTAPRYVDPFAAEAIQPCEILFEQRPF